MSRAVSKEKEGKRAAILKSAAKLFRKKSFAGTTVKDIAEDAGIQQGSLYYYITSKEDVLFEIINHILEDAITKFKEILTLELDPPQKLILAIKTHIGFVAEHQDEMAIAIETTEALSPDRFRIVEDKRDLYVDMFEGIIREGIEKGYFRKDLFDPKIVTFALLGMCNWVVKWFSSSGRLKPYEISDIFADLFLYGILRREREELKDRVSFVKKTELELSLKQLIEDVEKGGSEIIERLTKIKKMVEE